MTIDDLAACLHVAKSTLYKLAQEGKVPGHKVGKHWRFNCDAVDTRLKESDQAICGPSTSNDSGRKER